MSDSTVPTLKVAGGAMNRNALSLIRTRSLDLLATFVLDDPDRGAANPWAACFSDDGKALVVSHAGTNEISVIDWPALLRSAARRSGAADLFDGRSLAAMTGIRRRFELPLAGPRAVSEAGGVVYAAGYFSDNLVTVDLRQQPPAVREVALAPRLPPPLARLGEQYFNDATLCFQHWQSGASCHPDGRADALYWDPLNDGLVRTSRERALLRARPLRDAARTRHPARCARP